MDFSLQSHKSFIGLPATQLPTPSLVLSKPVIENNIQQLADDVKQLKIAFRPHVKTLKVSLLQFSQWKHETDHGVSQQKSHA